MKLQCGVWCGNKITKLPDKEALTEKLMEVTVFASSEKEAEKKAKKFSGRKICQVVKMIEADEVCIGRQEKMFERLTKVIKDIK